MLCLCARALLCTSCSTTCTVTAARFSAHSIPSHRPAKACQAWASELKQVLGHSVDRSMANGPGQQKDLGKGIVESWHRQTNEQLKETVTQLHMYASRRSSLKAQALANLSIASPASSHARTALISVGQRPCQKAAIGNTGAHASHDVRAHRRKLCNCMQRKEKRRSVTCPHWHHVVTWSMIGCDWAPSLAVVGLTIWQAKTLLHGRFSCGKGSWLPYSSWLRGSCKLHDFLESHKQSPR